MLQFPRDGSSARVLVTYVRHVHRYSYLALPVHPPPFSDENGAEGHPEASTAEDGGQGASDDRGGGRNMGYRLGSMVHQLRENYEICPHNFRFPGRSTMEFREALYALEHSRRDCRPCGQCVDVWFEHDHVCPPVMLSGTANMMGNFCTNRCIMYGVNCRPHPLQLRALHHCPGSDGGPDSFNALGQGRQHGLRNDRSPPGPEPLRLRPRLMGMEAPVPSG
jgi:hypothetical protein